MQLLQAQPIPISPDQYFWYVIASVFALALIWVIKIYLNKTWSTLEALLAITNRHDTEITVLKSEQENHKNDITELKDFKDSGLADSIVAKIRAITPPKNGK